MQVRIKNDTSLFIHRTKVIYQSNSFTLLEHFSKIPEITRYFIDRLNSRIARRSLEPFHLVTLYSDTAIARWRDADVPGYDAVLLEIPLDSVEISVPSSLASKILSSSATDCKADLPLIFCPGSSLGHLFPTHSREVIAFHEALDRYLDPLPEKGPREIATAINVLMQTAASQKQPEFPRSVRVNPFPMKIKTPPVILRLLPNLRCERRIQILDIALNAKKPVFTFLSRKTTHYQYGIQPTVFRKDAMPAKFLEISKAAFPFVQQDLASLVKRKILESDENFIFEEDFISLDMFVVIFLFLVSRISSAVDSLEEREQLILDMFEIFQSFLDELGV